MPAMNTSPRAKTVSAWRWFPWAIAGAIGAVVVVNAGMVTMAVRGFPGKVGRNGFDLSNQYNAVLGKAEEAARLGWSVDVALREGRPVVTVRDGSGQVPAGAVVRVQARRPLGPPEERTLVMRDAADGARIADSSLPGHGQWELDITVETPAAVVHTFRRINGP